MTCHRVRKEEVDRNLTRRRPLGRFVAVIVPLVWFLVLLLLLFLPCCILCTVQYVDNTFTRCCRTYRCRRRCPRANVIESDKSNRLNYALDSSSSSLYSSTTTTTTIQVVGHVCLFSLLLLLLLSVHFSHYWAPSHDFLQSVQIPRFSHWNTSTKTKRQ